MRFILQKSEHIKISCIAEMPADTLRSSMLEETRDSGKMKSYINFNSYLKDGEGRIRFLDIRSKDVNGATADNLNKFQNNVASE